ncbi:MAG: hypothetical protein HKN23_09690 [Verrucomicrobiales bacterium]|nr:hypothetical protein [Verrucomicrobiales bacterium]
MSDTSSNSENDPEFAGLEEDLKRLRPSPMQADFVAELEQDLKRVRKKSRRETQIAMARFIPLAAAACIVLIGYLTIQLGYFSQESPETAAVEQVTPDPALVNGLPPRPVEDRFQPVSAQGYLRKTSAGGVIELEETGEFAREVSMEFEDVYHWHDPETGTSIRLFAPREERVLIQVPVD